MLAISHLFILLISTSQCSFAGGGSAGDSAPSLSPPGIGICDASIYWSPAAAPLLWGSPARYKAIIQGSRWFRLVVDLCVDVAMQTPKTPLKNTADELQGTLRMLQKTPYKTGITQLWNQQMLPYERKSRSQWVMCLGNGVNECIACGCV
jgi:hypothetical protein